MAKNIVVLGAEPAARSLRTDCARLSRIPQRQRSPLSTRTTCTSTNRDCSSSRSVSRRRPTSCDRATGNCEMASTSLFHRSTTSTSKPKPCISPTVAHWPTTSSSSPPVPRLLPEETEGLEAAWMNSAFTFYDLDGASALAGRLAHFDGGRLVVNVVDMPIKCPVAPLEFCFLADWYFTERGIRDRVQLTYVTPLDGAFTKPTAAKALAGLLEDKGVELVTEFNTGEVDGAERKLVFIRRPRGAVRSRGRHSAPRGRAVCRPLTRTRRRAELRSDRRSHAPIPGASEHLRDRRCDNGSGVEGGLGHALRG